LGQLNRMGSYCELFVSKFPIATYKNAVDPLVLSIFQPEDLVVFDRKIGDPFKLLHGRDSESDERERAIQYISTAKKIKERLNVIGFTIKRVEEAFEYSKKESIELLSESLDHPFSNINESNDNELNEEIELLKNSTLSDFLNASKEIIENELGFPLDKEIQISKNPIVNYLLQERYGLDKFPFDYDQRTLLRAILEITKPNESITYDITELVEAGYYECEPESVYNEVIDNITYDHEIGDKILILTEGSSDIEILKNSLELLYPHLSGYYSFMDFGTSNAMGSAGSLVASVKSFVGADIRNKIIALFDNDTAAESAIRGLSKTKLPENIKVIQYPNIKFLEVYPTISPSGITEMNINGLAGSIEMYLGKDSLTDGKELIPIKWKGVDSPSKKHQGEIVNKLKVQKKFDKRIRACKENPEVINNYDWSGIDQILKMIFEIFNK
jgi:hypothetical protein